MLRFENNDFIFFFCTCEYYFPNTLSACSVLEILKIHYWSYLLPYEEGIMVKILRFKNNRIVETNECRFLPYTKKNFPNTQWTWSVKNEHPLPEHHWFLMKLVWLWESLELRIVILLKLLVRKIANFLQMWTLSSKYFLSTQCG